MLRDDLPRLIAKRFELQDGDVVIVTSKAISKVKGYVLNLEDVKPTLTSKILAKLTGKSPDRRGPAFGFKGPPSLHSHI